MSKATIVNGRWSRKIPNAWGEGDIWRADMFKSVLNNARLNEAEFICEGGPTICIPAEDLRRVLPLGRDHYGEKIWGPFNINLATSMIDGHPVRMQIVNSH